MAGCVFPHTSVSLKPLPPSLTSSRSPHSASLQACSYAPNTHCTLRLSLDTCTVLNKHTRPSQNHHATSCVCPISQSHTPANLTHLPHSHVLHQPFFTMHSSIMQDMQINQTRPHPLHDDCIEQLPLYNTIFLRLPTASPLTPPRTTCGGLYGSSAITWQ